MARKNFKRQLRRVVRIQCLWRVKKARVVYRELKREARDVNNMKSLNKGLENKIMELKRKLDQKSEECKKAELKLEKAAESGQMSDDKIAEIVGQLGEVSAERDELYNIHKQKDIRIEVSYFCNNKYVSSIKHEPHSAHKMCRFILNVKFTWNNQICIFMCTIGCVFYTSYVPEKSLYKLDFRNCCNKSQHFKIA